MSLGNFDTVCVIKCAKIQILDCFYVKTSTVHIPSSSRKQLEIATVLEKKSQSKIEQLFSFAATDEWFPNSIHDF